MEEMNSGMGVALEYQLPGRLKRSGCSDAVCGGGKTLVCGYMWFLLNVRSYTFRRGNALNVCDGGML